MGVDHYYWFYSTLAQSLAALIGVILVIAVFRLQVIYSNLERKQNDFASLVIKLEGISVNEFYPMDKLFEILDEKKSASLSSNDKIKVDQLIIREKNILRLKSYRQCLKGRVLGLIIYLSLLFIVSMICLHFSPYFKWHPNLAIYVMRGVFVLLILGGYLFIRFCLYCINYGVMEDDETIEIKKITEKIRGLFDKFCGFFKNYFKKLTTKRGDTK